MDLWNQISTNLGARYIAVEDASRKRWGYGFCRGSFGVTEQNYNEAIETLGSLVLDDIARDLSKTK
ncbi:PHD finger protein MALE meiocyte DEATH-like protein [Medicago truncatula]|uniref:PHD finger protein MALE meiocyte DEATH-like protein n=1 Tax=Medicago truncatula TaxID=3880 RepID=G7L8B3_MEDTR|nr:PHD finger protein MALE meiocyte DEATH-like protein [Medicago truncatula]KEH15863.1 PHD finger protein MALE meiocyte DEATH-like protein [Medicago truncatula]